MTGCLYADDLLLDRRRRDNPKNSQLTWWKQAAALCRTLTSGSQHRPEKEA